MGGAALRHARATLFGLAPCGVLPATDVAAGAVRSYRTFSPLLAFVLRTSAEQARERVRTGLSVRLFMLTGLPRRSAEGAKAGGMFSVPLVRQVALPGRYPAHCPLEFGLSSRLRPSGLSVTARSLAGTNQPTSTRVRRPAIV